jgi:hypothetical protein
VDGPLAGACSARGMGTDGTGRGCGRVQGRARGAGAAGRDQLEAVLPGRGEARSVLLFGPKRRRVHQHFQANGTERAAWQRGARWVGVEDAPPQLHARSCLVPCPPPPTSASEPSALCVRRHSSHTKFAAWPTAAAGLGQKDAIAGNNCKQLPPNLSGAREAPAARRSEPTYRRNPSRRPGCSLLAAPRLCRLSGLFNDLPLLTMPAPAETSLRDSQIIRRDAPAPATCLKGPNWNPSPQEDRQMLAMMGPMWKLLCYNKVRRSRAAVAVPPGRSEPGRRVAAMAAHSVQAHAPILSHSAGGGRPHLPRLHDPIQPPARGRGPRQGA